mgnify:CR=1 FL=1
MTLDDLKQEIATQQGERMEEVFKFIKEQALSGEFEVRLFGDRVNGWQIELLKSLGYTVNDYGGWYIVSGWNSLYELV